MKVVEYLHLGPCHKKVFCAPSSHHVASSINQNNLMVISETHVSVQSLHLGSVFYASSSRHVASSVNQNNLKVISETHVSVECVHSIRLTFRC